MILKFSVGAAVVVSLLAAFLIVRTGDETAVAGTTVVLGIYDESGADREEVRALIASTARAEDVTLYGSRVSTQGDRISRSLFVVNEGTGRSLPIPGSEYPDFGRSVDTHFAPPKPGSSPGGLYFTDADPGAVDRLASALRQLGMEVIAADFGLIGQVEWTAEAVPLLPLLVAAFFGLLLGCVHSTLASRRRNAIGLIYGASRGRTILAHGVRGIALTLGFGSLGLLATVPILALYNGLAQFWRFCFTASAGLATVAVLVAVIVMTTAAVTTRSPLLPALLRASPVRRVAFFGLVVHTVAIALVLVVLGSVVDSAAPALENRRDASEWARADGYLTLSFRVSNAEGEKSIGRFGDVGREALLRGTGLLAAGSADPSRGYDAFGGNSLIANRKFVSEQTILGRDGRRVNASALVPGALTLLVPDGIRVGELDLIQEYREWLDFQAEVAGSEQPSTLPITVVRTRAGQRVFDYSTAEPTSSQLDPVVAVLPSSLSFLSAEWIGSAMTQGRLLFSDRRALETELRSSGLDTSVEVIPAADVAATRLGEQERTARAGLFAGLLAVVVAVLAGGIFAASLAQLYRRQDLVRQAHGARTWRVMVAPASAVLILGMASIKLLAHLSILPAQVQLLLAGGLVVADTAVVVGLFLVFRRRLRADTLKGS